MVNSVVAVATNLNSKEVVDMRTVFEATGQIILSIKPSMANEVQVVVSAAGVVQEVIKSYKKDGRLNIEKVIQSTGSIVVAIDSSMLPTVEIVQAALTAFNKTIEDLNNYGTVKMSSVLNGLADVSDYLEPRYSEMFRIAVDISV